jgi:hypothetical protein
LRSLNNASPSRSITPQDAVKATGAQQIATNQWEAKCPHCDDGTLLIGKATDGTGKLLMRCSAGCAFLDVIFRIKQMRLKQESPESCQPTPR